MNGPPPIDRSLPEVRARFLKVHEEELRAVPGGERVLEQLDPEVLAAIRAASSIDWLPVQYELEYTRAIYAALEPAAAAAHIRRHALGASRSPLLEAIVRTALNMVGRAPALLAHRLPLVWGIAFRNCGTWRVETSGPTEVVLDLVGLPPVLAGSQQWLESAAPAIAAVLDVAGVQGEVRLVEQRPGSARYRMTWTAKAG